MKDERREEAGAADTADRDAAAGTRGLEQGAAVEQAVRASVGAGAEAAGPTGAEPAEGWGVAWPFAGQIHEELGKLLARVELSAHYHLDREAHFRRLDGLVGALALLTSAGGLGTMLKDSGSRWAPVLVGISAVVQGLARRLKLEREVERHRSLYVQFNQLHAEMLSMPVVDAGAIKSMWARVTKLESDERKSSDAAMAVAGLDFARSRGQAPAYRMRCGARLLRHWWPNGVEPTKPLKQPAEQPPDK